MSDLNRREFLKRLGRTGVGVGISTLLGKLPKEEPEPEVVEDKIVEQLFVSARAPASSNAYGWWEMSHG